MKPRHKAFFVVRLNYSPMIWKAKNQQEDFDERPGNRVSLRLNTQKYRERNVMIRANSIHNHY